MPKREDAKFRRPSDLQHHDIMTEFLEAIAGGHLIVTVNEDGEKKSTYAKGYSDERMRQLIDARMARNGRPMEDGVSMNTLRRIRQDNWGIQTEKSSLPNRSEIVAEQVQQRIDIDRIAAHLGLEL